MDDSFFTSPLATVQLIPIVNYLNILSDFLFIENYLAEVNQNKQIPIVNALYEYFDENLVFYKKVILIRNLLRGSDLYGALDSEELNAIFVNSMFDYIISSLVFDKYGNIYGFLAEVVRRTENLQYNHVLMVAKETLRNATFENEYGVDSVLSNLAVDRIYNDIILPLFPQPDTDLSLLSLDYIFAQAGSMFLRLGKINDTYFPGNDKFQFVKINNSFRNNTKKNYFNEYLAIGYVIKKLICSEKIDPLNLQVFALSALFYYVSNRVTNDPITNVTFSPYHWKMAYGDLFEYLDNAFERIENQLTEYYTYKIHLAFSYFQNYAAIADFVLDIKCSYLRKKHESEELKLTLSDTIDTKNIKNFECTSGIVVPDIKEWFQDQINNIGQIYTENNLEITEETVSDLIKDLRHVVIILLFTNNEIVNEHFNNSQQLYDLFEFYCPETKTTDYYALIRENNTVTLINESDNPKFFRKKLDPYVDQLIKSGHRTILKNAEGNAHQPNQELSKDKTDDLKDTKRQSNSILRYSDDNLKRNEWWTKFGLSLVPPNPCLLNIKNHDDISFLCKTKNIKFLNQFQEKTSQLTNEDIESFLSSLGTTIKTTQSLLSSLGTTIETIFLKDSISAIVDAHVNFPLSSEIIDRSMDSVFDTFSLQIEEPAFVSTCTTQSDIKLVTLIVHDLGENINCTFTYVEDILNNMKIRKTSFMIPLRNTGERKDRLLFVNADINYVGYGYKFTIIRTSNGTGEYAQLRTGYEFKDDILIIPIQNSSKHVKMYAKLNNTTFDIEADYIYEIDNQLRKKSTRMLFFGIFVQNENNNNTSIENCGNEDLENRGHSDVCLRHWRFVSKKRQEEEAVQFFKNKALLFGKNFISDEQIRNTLKKYIFPDANESLTYFVDSWLKDEKFENSDWSRKYRVENPELFNKLMYDVHLGNCNLSLPDGKKGIDSIYTYRERRKIEDGTSLENVIQDYNEQKACYSVTFEDYYAIRNFATTGDRRITGDTTEAKLMKIALYKLAIRQFEIFDEKFETKLFRIETKQSDFVIRQLFKGKRIVLQKFLSTSTSIGSELRFSAYPASGFRNILYEFNFLEPYFRAEIGMKIDQFEVVREKKVILLPGSEFKISKISIVRIGGIGNVLKVVLSSLNGNYGKYEWNKNIRREITRN